MNANFAKEIIDKHSEILRRLERERIFKLIISEDCGGSIDIMECCDEWFEYSLTKDDCENLSLLFSELSKVV